MRVVLIVLGFLIALFFLGWLGIKIKSKPFPPYSQKSGPFETVPLPAGLPGPVERFYRQVYGDELPVITSAVISGRATLQMKPGFPKLPARFRFIHNAGKDYRHYIEATFFGMPLMKVNERYVDGSSLFELPFGVFENDPNITQGAVLGLWAESVWFPSIFVTDARVHWAPVDEYTALLYVPFGDQEEDFVVRFDPETGLIRYMEAMRFRDAGDQAKILWITEALQGETTPGTGLSAVGSATWFDTGKPWAVFTLEDVVFNVDVSQYIRQKGP